MTFTDEESIIADILAGIDTVPEMLDKHVPPETGYKYFRERYGAILRDRIKEFGDIIEHGPYIYGEYSDDIDEAVERLCWDGIAKHIDDHKGSIALTDYGRAFLQEFIEGGEFEDEDWEKVRRRMI